MNTVALSPRRASRWPWVFVVLAVLAGAALLVGWNLLEAVNPAPLSVVIDGERVFDGLDLSSLPPAHKVLLVGVLAIVLLAMLVVVPVTLLLVLAGVLVAVLAAVGLPLLVAFAVLALVLSPLWLGIWLLLKLLG